MCERKEESERVSANEVEGRTTREPLSMIVMLVGTAIPDGRGVKRRE